MPSISSGRSILLAGGLALAFTASAAAQDAATPAITVNGTAQVKPKPRDRNDEASIAKAVRRAHAAATPLAIADGNARAATLAGLAGVTLGPVLEIAQAPPTPFPYFGLGGQDGTFGPGKYCGTIRSSRLTKTKGGKRRRVVTTRHGCRVPTAVTETLSMTFSTLPPA